MQTTYCSKQKIDVGERVTQRHGQVREGIVVGNDRETKADKPQWSVLFKGSDEPERNIRSTKLRLVKDKRVFKWRITKDSTADDPVTPFRKTGIAGFKFEDAFQDITTFEGPSYGCLLYTSPSPRDQRGSRMPSSA